jgi:hypothetical protein
VGGIAAKPDVFFTVALTGVARYHPCIKRKEIGCGKCPVRGTMPDNKGTDGMPTISMFYGILIRQEAVSHQGA